MVRIKHKPQSVYLEATAHPALKDYFGYCLYKSGAQLKALHQSYLVEYGVLPVHFGVLTVLNASGKLSQMKMGVEMGIDKATMVKLIDDLEEKRLVSRESDQKDRRINCIQITPKGQALLRSLKSICVQVENEFFACLTKEEIQQLKKIVPKLLR